MRECRAPTTDRRERATPTFPTGKVPPQRQKRRKAANLQAPPRLPHPPSVREVPPRGRQRRANAPSSMRSLPQPASPAAPSQRERKEAAKRTTALLTFGLPPHQPLRRQLPPGEARGLLYFSAAWSGRDISLRSATARPEQSEGLSDGALGAQLSQISEEESPEGRALVKSPSLWRVLSSPSFCTSRKVVPPEGAALVLSKRTTAVRIYSLSLFRRLRAAPSPEGRLGLPHFRALSSGRDISFCSSTARPEQSEGPSDGA
jgi:hypothetical protein